MSGLGLLVAKELGEQARRYRVLTLCAVFLFFGLGSPLTARLMPELVRRVGAGPGITITMPPPTAADAVGQYVKNISQIVLLVVVLLSSGAVVGEKEGGTAAFLLVKGVSRGRLIVAKLLALWTTAAAGLMLSAAGCYLYTVVLFGALDPLPFTVTGLLLLVHVLTFVATTLLASSLARSQVVAAILAFLIWVALASAGMLGRISDFLPGHLLTLALAGTPAPGAAWEPVAGSGILSVLSVVLSWLLLRRWEP